MKIKIRSLLRRENQPPIKVQVKEKQFFHCKNCNNRYYEHHHYCPQCLGRTEANYIRPSRLLILSCPKERKDELTSILQSLSGKNEFAYTKLLQKFPATILYVVDQSVATEWQQMLRASKFETLLEDCPSDSKKKSPFSLFEGTAPCPLMMNASIDAAVREATSGIKDATLKNRWVMAVLRSHEVLQDLFVKNPAERVLFSDLIYRIEHDLADCSKNLAASAPMVERHLSKLEESLTQIVTEIQEVRSQVQEQL